MTMNKVVIVGRLGADPEHKETSAGNPMARMSIATNRAWTGRDGQRKEDTQWHKVVVFGPQAAACAAHLGRGEQVGVEGRLETYKWTDDDGVEHRRTQIVAQLVHFLAGGGGEGRTRQAA